MPGYTGSFDDGRISFGDRDVEEARRREEDLQPRADVHSPEATEVAALMNDQPVHATMHTPIPDVARLMRDQQVGMVPVVDEANRLVGVVTEREILGHITDRFTEAREIMERAPHALRPDGDLVAALETMGQDHTRMLPVVDDDGRLVGSLSIEEIARQAEHSVVLQNAIYRLSARASFWAGFWV